MGNRLPPMLENIPVKPLLTEEEIINGEEPQSEDSGWEFFSEMKADDLGPCGCCDCCHTHGLNCGTKWPHGTGLNYLYMTPQFCNNLVRLGHEISGEAVDA